MDKRTRNAKPPARRKAKKAAGRKRSPKPFDPESPPPVGSRVVIQNAGSTFDGYPGTITEIDRRVKEVEFAIRVGKRHMSINMDFRAAAQLLGVLKFGANPSSRR